MNTVANLMTSEIHVCHPGETLARVARILWERDCGAVPVIDEQCRPVGLITDRDVCMAALTRGAPLHELSVASTLGDQVHCVGQDDALAVAHETMRIHQLRRLPVVDAEGRLTGILSLSDLARQGLTLASSAARREACEQTGLTLAAVTRQPGTSWQMPGASTLASAAPSAAPSAALGSARELTEAVGGAARTATPPTPPTPQRDVATGKPATAGESAGANISKTPPSKTPPSTTPASKTPASMGRGTSRKATTTKAPAKTSRKSKQPEGGAATGPLSTGAAQDALGGPTSRAAEQPPQRGGATRSS